MAVSPPVRRFVGTTQDEEGAILAPSTQTASVPEWFVLRKARFWPSVSLSMYRIAASTQEVKLPVQPIVPK